MKFSDVTITSRQNPLIVRVCKLDDRKTRESECLFRFDGVKLFCEAVRAGLTLSHVFLRDSTAEKLLQHARDLYGADVTEIPIEATLVSDEVFAKMTDQKAPDGILCLAKSPLALHRNRRLLGTDNDAEIFAADVADRSKHLFFLDSIRDPLNVGAMIRSAHALGIDRLVMSADCADLYNSRTLRAAMGTLFVQKIDRVDDLPTALTLARRSGRRIYAAALQPHADKLGDFFHALGDAVVVGNEGHGICDAVLRSCDGCVYIPMTPDTESLNAAAAAAILMWEFRR